MVIDKKVFFPSMRFGYIIGTILLIVLVLSLANFPMNIFSVTSLDQKVIFEIGWPSAFFAIDMLSMGLTPIKWGVLFLSLIGYLLVSYVIDIVISIIIAGLKKPLTPEEVLTQARKAYFYYKSQGMEEAKIVELFKQKGWKDGDIEKLK